MILGEERRAPEVRHDHKLKVWFEIEEGEVTYLEFEIVHPEGCQHEVKDGEFSYVEHNCGLGSMEADIGTFETLGLKVQGTDWFEYDQAAIDLLGLFLRTSRDTVSLGYCHHAWVDSWTGEGDYEFRTWCW